MKKIRTLKKYFGHKLMVFSFGLLLFSSLSCNKKIVGFDMYYKRTYNIPVGINPFVSTVWNSDYITPDTTTFFSVNASSSAKVLKVIPKSMQLSSIYPSASTTLDNLTRVEVTIFDPARPAIPAQTIFYRDNVPANTAYTLDLLPNAVDVKDLVIYSKKFIISISIQVAQPPPRTIETQFSVYFTAQTE